MDKISNAIKCVNCQLVLKSPVFLPCHHSVCKHHVQIDIPIICEKCGKKHDTPHEGFPDNEPLAEIIAAQVHSIKLGKEHEKAKQNIEGLESLINEIEAILADPTYLTIHEIDSIRNTVFLKREELKLKIDQETEKLITKIDEFVERIKNSVNANEYKLLEEQTKLAKSNLNQNKSRINEIKVDDEYWKKTSEEIKFEIKLLAQNLENFKKPLVLEGLDELKIQSNFFQNLDIDFNYISGSNQMDSKIIDPDGLKFELMRLCEFPLCVKWTLLYRGSENSFNWTQFHAKCDNKSPTLTIVKTKTGLMFGGYTEAQWNDPFTLNMTSGFLFSQSTQQSSTHKNKFKSDSNAFLFILKDLLNKKSVKARVSERNNAIYCDHLVGPAFGRSDFGLKENKCIFRIGTSYHISEDCQNDSNSCFILDIKDLEEVEVFQKV